MVHLPCCLGEFLGEEFQLQPVLNVSRQAVKHLPNALEEMGPLQCSVSLEIKSTEKEQIEEMWKCPYPRIN